MSNVVHQNSASVPLMR